MAYYVVSDGTLSSIADAIRYKGSTSASMAFPDGFISAINDISGGGGDGAKQLIERSFPNGQFIDNTASYVAERAFYFSPVQYVSMGSVKTISMSAFYQCQSLSDMCFPECTSISVEAFAYCSGLTRITSSTFPKCTTIDSRAFHDIPNIEIFEIPTLQSITDSLLGQWGQFQSKSSLSYVDIGSVEIVPSSMFARCPNLTTVRATNLREIKAGAFSGCSNLSSIDITNVSVFGNYAFSSCALAGHITIDPSVSSYGNGCFCGNKFTTASFIGYSVVPSLLCSNSLLYSVDVGSATELGPYAFVGCTALSSLSFAITSAGYYALASCGFSRVPSNTLSLMPSGFMYSCESLMEISLSDFTTSSTAVMNYAFAYCTNLSKVEMQQTYISSNVFRGCTSLKTVSLPNASTFYEYAFANCGVEEISLPRGRGFSIYAFDGCTSLREIRIGYNGYGWGARFSSFAFRNCQNLISLYLYGNDIAYFSNWNVFNSTPIYNYSDVAGRLGNVYVPSGLLNNYKQDVFWGQISDRIFAIPDEEL